MRLLFYVDHFRLAERGQQTRIVQLCRSLSERGHEVHVLSDDAEDAPGITVHRGLSESVALCGRILPDLCIDWGFIQPADLHCLGGGTYNQFITYTMDAYHGVAKLLRRFNYQKLEHQRVIARQKTMLANPNAHFLVNSQQTADMAVADGADAERISIHCQSVDLHHFSPDRMHTLRGDSRELLGIDEDDVVFMLAAHNLKLKNIDLLRRVFSSLPKEHNGILLVAGTSPPDFSAPWLRYAGTTAPPEAFYAAADVLAHPTWFDACAPVVIEAMACGRPVIVSDSAGVNEVVRHGMDGSLLPVRGPRRKIESVWRNGILSIIKDEGLRKRQGTSARERSETYGYDSFLQWFNELLLNVRREKEQRESLTPID